MTVKVLVGPQGDRDVADTTCGPSIYAEFGADLPHRYEFCVR